MLHILHLTIVPKEVFLSGCLYLDYFALLNDPVLTRKNIYILHYDSAFLVNLGKFQKMQSLFEYSNKLIIETKTEFTWYNVPTDKLTKQVFSLTGPRGVGKTSYTTYPPYELHV